MALLPNEVLNKLPFGLRGELEENLVRKDFTQRELAEFQERLYHILQDRFPKGVRGDRRVGNLPTLDVLGADNIDEVIAEAFDEGFRTVQKRRAIYEAAQEDPKRFSPLMDELEQTGKVDPIYRRFKSMTNDKPAKQKPAVVRHVFILTTAQEGAVQAALGLCGGEPGAAIAEICAFYTAHNG